MIFYVNACIVMRQNREVLLLLIILHGIKAQLSSSYVWRITKQSKQSLRTSSVRQFIHCSCLVTLFFYRKRYQLWSHVVAMALDSWTLPSYVRRKEICPQHSVYIYDRLVCVQMVEISMNGKKINIFKIIILTFTIMFF